MNTAIKHFLLYGAALVAISSFFSQATQDVPVKRMLSFAKPISFPTGGNQTDIYVDNRTSKDILVEIPGYEYQIVTPGERDGKHKKIFAISPQNIAIGANKAPHLTFSLVIDGINVSVECWSTTSWSTAGVRVNGKYTERSAAVVGISQESIVFDVYGTRYEVLMQVYPFYGKPDINLIVRPA